MGRPKKFVNTSGYPDFVIETLARTFYEKMLEEISEQEETPTENSDDIPIEKQFYTFHIFCNTY